MHEAKKTTYIIYRIWNIVTHKSYIGQTVNYKKRAGVHFSQLKAGKHYNLKLQRAYDKYGQDSFRVETLEGVTSIEELNKREMYWITHFNSCDNGYNLTRGGDQPDESSKTSCVWNDVEYPSISAAAQALGITTSSMSMRLKKGYTRESDLLKPEDYHLTRPVIWNGIQYHSIKDAALAMGITKTRMKAWVDKGYTCDEDVKSNNPYSVTIDGVEFPTVKEAMKHYGVSRQVIDQFAKDGKSRIVLRFKGQCKRVEIDGLVFASIMEASNYYNVDRHTIKTWIKKGRGRYL